MPVGELVHEAVVTGLAWNANKPGQICTVQDNQYAQIWEIRDHLGELNMATKDLEASLQYK